jgi:hypothetical protein
VPIYKNERKQITLSSRNANLKSYGFVSEEKEEEFISKIMKEAI